MKLGELFRSAATAPLRGMWRLLPGWARVLLVAAVVVVPLAFLGPVLDFVVKLLDLLLRLLQPLLDNMLGRVFLLLCVFGLAFGLGAMLLRARIRAFRSSLVLGRHLQATAALIGDDRRRCREQFLRVARWRGPLPDAYPAVVQDARLKLARLCLEAGDVDEALAWLARVVEPKLPKELRRSLLQLRARAMRLQPEVLPETRIQALEHALAQCGDDYALLQELRLARAGAPPAELAALQERILASAPAVQQAAERQRLVEDLDAAGKDAIARHDLAAARTLARKLAKVDRDGPASGLLHGAIHAAAGDLRAAIAAWGGTRSPEGLDLVAGLLREHPGVMDARELLVACPMQGTLLLLAREFARSGEVAKAERAARVAAQTLGPTPSVVAVLGEVLLLLGEEQQAALLAEQAVLRLLGAGPERPRS